MTPGGAQHAADTGRSTAPGTAGPAAAGAGRPAGLCARRGWRTPDCGVSAPAGGPGGPGAGGSGAARAPAGAARSGVALATRARLRGRCCGAPAGGGGCATCSSAPPASTAALSLALLVCPSSSTAWSSEALAEGCSAALLESEGTSSTGCAAAYVRRAGWRRSRAPRRCIAAARGRRRCRQARNCTPYVSKGEGSACWRRAASCMPRKALVCTHCGSCKH